MRCLLMVVTVLATLNSITISTTSAEDSVQLDKKALQQVESNLLSLFGLNRRPRPNRKNVRIPKAMLDLYKLQTGQDVDTSMLPLPGRHTRSANTVRTFTHQGRVIFYVGCTMYHGTCSCVGNTAKSSPIFFKKRVRI